VLFAGLFGFRGVRGGGDYEAVAADAIKDGLRSAADDELPDAGLRSNSAGIGINSQCFDDRNDASGRAGHERRCAHVGADAFGIFQVEPHKTKGLQNQLASHVAIVVKLDLPEHTGSDLGVRVGAADAEPSLAGSRLVDAQFTTSGLQAVNKFLEEIKYETQIRKCHYHNDQCCLTSRCAICNPRHGQWTHTL